MLNGLTNLDPRVAHTPTPGATVTPRAELAVAPVPTAPETVPNVIAPSTATVEQNLERRSPLSDLARAFDEIARAVERLSARQLEASALDDREADPQVVRPTAAAQPEQPPDPDELARETARAAAIDDERRQSLQSAIDSDSRALFTLSSPAPAVPAQSAADSAFEPSDETRRTRQEIAQRPDTALAANGRISADIVRLVLQV